MSSPLFKRLPTKRSLQSLHRTKTNDSLTTMSTISTSTSSSRPTSRNYDTGFPDSFASCTTSLRHPDAIIDPAYSISTEDVDPAKTFHRSRKSFLSKHKRTISHGVIVHQMDQNASTSSVLPSIDSAVDIMEMKDEHGSIGGFSKDGAESIDHMDDTKGDLLASNTMFGSPGQGLEEDEEDESRRGKIFRKFRVHKE
ncbi:hypothetical protein F4775DRAFT_560830 [Biscogniauxia sp. FL1348]|nr:hypothetical protein F4775DRAFT_560830 [Biscogniauxia sp. FL1348]